VDAVNLSWMDAAQPMAAGLAAMLGVFVTEDVLRAIRRRALCPGRWTGDRSLLLPRRSPPRGRGER